MSTLVQSDLGWKQLLPNRAERQAGHGDLERRETTMRVRTGNTTQSPAARTAVAAGAALLVAPLLLAAPAAGARARRQRAREPKQPVATGSGGAVASADLDASKAGIAVLRKGGNAIDAAVATASTLGVTEPFVAGPGGGGYMVIYLAKQHRVITLDGRETCPASCTDQQFIDPSTGKPLPFEEARRSGLSVGVPGMVATWAKAVRQYGRHSFGADLKPAVGVAERGFTIDSNFNQQERVALADLQTFKSSRSLFLTADGQPLPVGSTLRNPDLAQTYEQLAEVRTRLPVPGRARAPTSPASSSTRTSCPASRRFPDPARVDDHRRPGPVLGADAQADPRDLPRPRRLRHAAVVVGRPDRRRGAEHPVEVPASGPRAGPRPCSSTSRPRGSRSPTATPTSATPATSTSRSTACSTPSTRPRGRA